MNYPVKLVMCGESGVGKSSLMLRYVDNICPFGIPATLGVDCKVKSFNIADKKIQLFLWVMRLIFFNFLLV